MSLAFESLHGPGYRFPEQVSVAVPKGTKARIRVAADAAGIPASELLRRAVTRALSEPAALPCAGSKGSRLTDLDGSYLKDAA